MGTTCSGAWSTVPGEAGDGDVGQLEDDHRGVAAASPDEGLDV